MSMKMCDILCSFVWLLLLQYDWSVQRAEAHKSVHMWKKARNGNKSVKEHAASIVYCMYCMQLQGRPPLYCIMLGNSMSSMNYISDIWILHVQTSSSPEAGTNIDTSPTILETVKQVCIIAITDYNK